MRFLSTLFGTGRTTTPPADTGPIQTVQVRLSQYETLDARNVMTAYGLISCPPVGSDVLLACLSNDRSNSIVIGHNHQQHRFTGAQPGEAGIANPLAGSSILLKANGDIVITCASGTITAEGATITARDFVTESGVSLADHLHGGVQIGGSNTKGPVPS